MSKYYITTKEFERVLIPRKFVTVQWEGYTLIIHKEYQRDSKEGRLVWNNVYKVLTEATTGACVSHFGFKRITFADAKVEAFEILNRLGKEKFERGYKIGVEILKDHNLDPIHGN
jgi:hypothetical protein